MEDQNFPWPLMNRVVTRWIIFSRRGVNELNVSRGILITKDRFSCGSMYGPSQQGARFETDGPPSSSVWSVFLWSGRLIQTESKRVWWLCGGLSLSLSTVCQRKSVNFKSACACLPAQSSHFLTCGLEFRAKKFRVFFYFFPPPKGRWESQTDCNPLITRVVCHLQPVREQKVTSA